MAEQIESLAIEQQRICGKCKSKRTAINYCKDCDSLICEMCTKMHREWTELSKHELVSFESDLQLPPPKKASLCMYCSYHCNEELESYCKTCGELICHSCKLNHQDHQHYPVTSSMESVESMLCKIRQTLEEISAHFKEVDDRKRIVEAEIRQSIEKHQSLMEERMAELLDQLSQVAKEKHSILEHQQKEIQHIQTQLMESLSIMTEHQKSSNHEKMMKMMTEISKLFDPNLSLCLECEASRLKFAPSPELAQACQEFGEVYTEKVSPEKCYALGKGLEVAIADEESKLTLHIVDNKENTCSLSIRKLACSLVSDTTADEAECLIKELKPSKYEIRYKPPTRGRYQLQIKVDGRHIKGSPFSVTVKLPVHKLGSPIKTIRGVREPWGIAINQKGEIIVAEDSNHCVSIYSPKGEKFHCFDSQDSEYGGINRPRGVAVDDDGNILVVERGRNSIHFFSSQGKFLKACGDGIDCSGKPVGLNWPKGIGIHPLSKKIYVADDRNHVIKIIDPDSLSLEKSIGGEGTDDGQFKNPWDVDFDTDGNVYIADKSNNRIQVFTAEGDYLWKFGKKGNQSGELDQPSSICIDCDNIIYVTEYANHRVSVFNYDGKFLTSFGSRGSDIKQFERPRGITVDKSGIVYVCDSDNDCIKLF